MHLLKKSSTAAKLAKQRGRTLKEGAHDEVFCTKVFPDNVVNKGREFLVSDGKEVFAKKSWSRQTQEFLLKSLPGRS